MADAALVRGFSFGSVISGSAAVFARNFFPFMILALVITLPTLLYDLYGPQPRTQREVTVYEALGNIIGFICSTLLTATLTYGTVQELRGRHASLGASIGQGFGVMLPALGVSLVVGIGVAIGMVLLIVPGLILMTIWWVAVPATVIERPGVFASLGRSTALTRGYRWPVFGIILLFTAVSFALVFVIGAILGPMVYRGTMGVTGFYVIIWGVVALISAFTSVLAGVSYFALRTEKEGVDIDQLAAVFD